MHLHREPYSLEFPKTQSVGPGALFASTWANASQIQYNIAWYYSWKLSDREREKGRERDQQQNIMLKDKQSKLDLLWIRKAVTTSPACSTATSIFTCTLFGSRISFKCKKYDVVCDPIRIECVNI